MSETLLPLRILLADDDLSIRLGLEKIISSHFPQEEILIFSCEDGLIAKQLLEREPVDVLITDIKMPFCSGIELLETIHEKGYSCHSIVLSGYDDFNLVRNAMRLGASDYLLKPVDEGLLIHTLKECQKSLPLKRTASEQTDLSHLLSMQRILESLLPTSKAVYPDGDSFISKHHFSTQTNCLMCYVDIKRALYSNHLTMFQFLADRVQSFIKTNLFFENQTFIPIYGGVGSYWIFLLFSHQTVSSADTILHDFFKQLDQDHLKYSFTPNWFLLKELPQADIFCRKGFEKYYFDLPYSDLQEESEETELSNYIEKAAAAAADYNYSVTIENLEHCFAIVNALKPPIPDVKKIWNHFVYTILNNNADFISIISSSKFTDYDILEYIETSECLSALKRNLYLSINHMIEISIQNSSNKDDFVIQKAKEYIQNNYSDDITLNDVASYVFLNSNYFSTLFKQKTGNTFRNYLRDVRITKAKDLLVTSNLRIYEIALMVGYKEHSHFVRAFKTVTGKNPGEFRDHS